MKNIKLLLLISYSILFININNANADKIRKSVFKPQISQTFSSNIFDKNVPWEMNSINQPLIQQLNYGNEITYSNQAQGKFYNIIEQAIKGWNNLKVIKLVQVNPDQNPEIKIDTKADQFIGNNNDLAAGSTKITNNNNIINSAWVSLNSSSYMQTLFNNDEYLQIAEHEIGHALGFDHDENKYTINNQTYVHIMYFSIGNYKSISLGETEANALKLHYAIK